MTAADEAEVRGALMFNALEYINQVASSIDLGRCAVLHMNIASQERF